MFTGWTDLVELMVDFNKEDYEPIPNNQPGYYVFVVVFVFLGAFFSLNMFVGVAVDTFKNLQERVTLGKTDMLLTDTQRKYYSAMLRLGRKKPVVRTERPSNKILNICYTITYSLCYLLLFRLTTAQGWEEVLESLSVQPPFCRKELGECGNKVLSVIFLLSFIIISNIILVNIFIAVILENYIEAVMQENDVINDDNLVHFYKVWKQFDPKASQFIAYKHLSDFLDQLNKDMRIPKPNNIAIAYMNLPIVKGNKIHCLSVLKGIIEVKAGDIEDSATFRILCDQVQKKHYGMFPKLKELKFVETTMQVRRREIAARIIHAYLKRRKNKKKSKM